MVGVTSVLITLSPNDVLSYCSVISCLEPSLDFVPVLKRSVNVSWNVVVVVFSTSFHLLPDVFLLLDLDVTSFLFLTLVLLRVPVQTVCQLPQRVLVIPVCGSKPPNFLSAAVTVSVKLPSVSNTLGSILTVLIQVSLDGDNLTVPCQKLSKKGVTLSVLVPKGCDKY